ncbi:MAG: DNA topoisomerase IV subunit A, partial [Planctomycetota bacterium JB042]
MTHLEPLLRRNFLEYASYVVLDRAIPDLRDGLKPVQRRLLQTLFEMHDGRLHQVANVIGETMKLHPHGDAAIADALIQLANKGDGLLIDRQGNFGSVLTGHRAAAPRYIECRLTKLAHETLFSPELTTFKPSYDGRKDEPEVLPAKLPLLLALGADGIAVGMATHVLPHSLAELLDAQVRLLNGEEPRVHPDFPQGGLLDVSEYDDGRGRVKARARIEARDDDRVVITELPAGTTTERLVDSIDEAVRERRLEVGAVTDLTTDRVEIEVRLAPGQTANGTIQRLYAFTECERTIDSSLVALVDGRPRSLTVTEALLLLNERLLDLTHAELTLERRKLERRWHLLSLERIFIEHRVYRRLEAAADAEGVRAAVRDGMAKHRHLFLREMVEDDVDHLLQIRIQRISRYDLDRNRAECEKIARELERIERQLADLKGTTIAWLRKRKREAEKARPRRSEILPFETEDRRRLVRKGLAIAYDEETGFLGTKVKGPVHRTKVSEYDRILAISDDGTYRVTPPVERVLLTGRVLHVRRIAPGDTASFVVVWRDPRRIAWAKRIVVGESQRNVKGEIVQGIPVAVDLLLLGDPPGKVHLEFEPVK